jgi:hypothetical protein
MQPLTLDPCRRRSSPRYGLGQVCSSIALKVLADNEPTNYLTAVYTEWAMLGIRALFTCSFRSPRTGAPARAMMIVDARLSNSSTATSRDTMSTAAWMGRWSPRDLRTEARTSGAARGGRKRSDGDRRVMAVDHRSSH